MNSKQEMKIDHEFNSSDYDDMPDLIPPGDLSGGESDGSIQETVIKIEESMSQAHNSEQHQDTDCSPISYKNRSDSNDEPICKPERLSASPDLNMNDNISGSRKHTGIDTFECINEEYKYKNLLLSDNQSHEKK